MPGESFSTGIWLAEAVRTTQITDDSRKKERDHVGSLTLPLRGHLCRIPQRDLRQGEAANQPQRLSEPHAPGRTVQGVVQARTAPSLHRYQTQARAPGAGSTAALPKICGDRWPCISDKQASARHQGPQLLFQR